VNDFISTDGVHAAEVDRAFTQEAWTTRDVVAYDFYGRVDGAGEERFGGSEDGNSAGAKGGGKVHGAAVVTEHKASVGDVLDEGGEGGLTREVMQEIGRNF